MLRVFGMENDRDNDQRDASRWLQHDVHGIRAG
jgi:hypothetical protein